MKKNHRKCNWCKRELTCHQKRFCSHAHYAQSLVGKKQTQSAINARRKYLVGNTHTKGMKFSEETNKKKSINNAKFWLGKKRDNSTIEKISIALKGRASWNKGQKGPENEQSYAWKGDRAGYHAKHLWIAKQLGKPTSCQFCNTTTAKKFEWANKSGKYQRVLSDWLRLCTRCHRNYDYLINKIMKQLYATA